METFFPLCGKIPKSFSIVWKNREKFFHCVENVWISQYSSIPNFHFFQDEPEGFAGGEEAGGGGAGVEGAHGSAAAAAVVEVGGGVVGEGVFDGGLGGVDAADAVGAAAFG